MQAHRQRFSTGTRHRQSSRRRPAGGARLIENNVADDAAGAHGARQIAHFDEQLIHTAELYRPGQVDLGGPRNARAPVVARLAGLLAIQVERRFVVDGGYEEADLPPLQAGLDAKGELHPDRLPRAAQDVR